MVEIVIEPWEFSTSTLGKYPSIHAQQVKNCIPHLVNCRPLSLAYPSRMLMQNASQSAKLTLKTFWTSKYRNIISMLEICSAGCVNEEPSKLHRFNSVARLAAQAFWWELQQNMIGWGLCGCWSHPLRAPVQTKHEQHLPSLDENHATSARTIMAHSCLWMNEKTRGLVLYHQLNRRR